MSVERFHIKASVAFTAWLDAFAKRCRTNRSGLIDQAVTEYARAKGFDAPPARLETKTEEEQ
jgi:predicted transcriptional regulator